MSFVQLAPAPPLDRTIERLWDWRVEPKAVEFERILPTPGAQLILNLGEDETRSYSDDGERRCVRNDGFVLLGQPTRSFLIDTAEQVAVMGVMFRPGAATAFFREPMHRLCDRHTAVADLDAPGASGLRERLLATGDARARLRLLERWLLRRLRPEALHPAVEFALRRIAAAPHVARVGELIDASGWSARRFGTLFREQVGVGAKAYARLRRFRSVVAEVQRGQGIEWAEVAAACGFHDQPHLVREFRAFAGMTPGEYLARRGASVNHVALP